MVNESEYYKKLKIKSNISTKIISKCLTAQQDQWKLFLDQTILKLSLDDFTDDPNIYTAINDLNCNDRLGVYKFEPNTVYNWHADKIRYSSINLLLEGFDSFCAFGNIGPHNSYKNVCKLEHEPNTYYLLNVKKFHTVFNFNNTRYLISIGIPETKYNDAIEYFTLKNLITQ